MVAGSHAVKDEVYNGVSTADEPSAAWGWHNIGSSAIQKAGWISVAFLLAYNFGNHKGHVETIYLITFAVVIALGLVLMMFPWKGKQVTTVTANNQPIDYEKPDYIYDQLTLSGTYANLTDSQLRSLNISPKWVRGEIESK
ncbi:MAG: DUF2631 domain-containing protein [Corynebacterium sp.]|nr:DUF2631 domain-containing protein [Corynebacterium sp.]